MKTPKVATPREAAMNDALCNWLEENDVPPDMFCYIAAHMIGSIAGERARTNGMTRAGLDKAIELASALIKASAHAEFENGNEAIAAELMEQINADLRAHLRKKKVLP